MAQFLRPRSVIEAFLKTDRYADTQRSDGDREDGDNGNINDAEMDAHETASLSEGAAAEDGEVGDVTENGDTVENGENGENGTEQSGNGAAR